MADQSQTDVPIPMPENEPDRSFYQAWLKVLWAELHIVNLQTRCQTFVAQHRYTVAFNHGDGPHDMLIDFKATNPVPVEVLLLAGDAVHNLRSALDYCWMGLLRSISTEAADRPIRWV
jgi:hypothetical protein